MPFDLGDDTAGFRPAPEPLLLDAVAHGRTVAFFQVHPLEPKEPSPAKLLAAQPRCVNEIKIKGRERARPSFRPANKSKVLSILGRCNQA